MHVNMIGLLLIHTSFVLNLPPSVIMELYLIHMAPQTSIVAHIYELRTAMMAHMQDPQ